MVAWLFSWEVTSVVVVAFATAAFGVLAMNDFKLAKLFFLIAAADAMGGIVMWGKNSRSPASVFVVVLLLGVVVALTVTCT